jgi:AraC-like DNA-binding protein
MTPHFRAASLSNYLEVAAQVGLEVVPMLRRVGIDRRTLDDPDTRIPAARVVQLLELSAAASDCPTFGLRMAESRQLADFGALSLLITHQATLRDALLTAVQYRQLLNPALLVELEDHGDLVVVREELVDVGAGGTRQAYDLAVGILYRLCRGLPGARWRAQSVNFTYPAPADLSVHRRIFGPICEFGSEFHGLTCRKADLDAPNPSADPALAHYAERFVRMLPNVDRRSLTHDVQKAIYLLLPAGRASIGGVSASLGMNERTLQRRLDAEGADFSRLLNGIRRDLTVRYLQNQSLSITHLAGLVGYSSQSTFSRWFAAEFGTPPTTWRRAQNRTVSDAEFAHH